MFVFDFDGVIANSLDLCTEACIRAARQQDYVIQMPANPFADLEHVNFEALAANLDLDSKKFGKDACDFLENSNRIAPIFSGMRCVLSQAATKGLVYILSASPGRTIKQFLQYDQCDEFIYKVVSRDLPGDKVTKLSLLQAQSHSPIFCTVGVGTSDISVAKQVGIPSIGVAWGWQEPDLLRSVGADYIANTPEEMTQILNLLIDAAPEKP